MRRRRAMLAMTCVLVLAASAALAAQLPDGYLRAKDARKILDKTQTVRLAPDLSGLTDGEHKALVPLLQVGKIMQRLYEQMHHHQSEEALTELRKLHGQGVSPGASEDLLDLYRLFAGPVVTTLENARVPFLPVDEERPGKNVYPLDATKDELDAFIESYPGALGPRSVIRRATDAAVAEDLIRLGQHPVIEALHPGLRAKIEEQAASGFYVVPYALAYAEDMVLAHDLLHEAARLVGGDDRDFADYLRLRARDLLTNDYEAGDAAWVSGRFRNLNAEVGAYETYADALYGVKAFYGVGLMVRDREKSDALARQTGGIQAIEESLPYESTKRVRDNLPIGVYNVIADFGHTRGTNTATILPNESHIARKYGRTILLRNNIMTHPDLFTRAREAFAVAVVEDQVDDLGLSGNFNRTVWHEIGHYLGPDLTDDGRIIDVVLQDNASLMEEMKADLISLFAAEQLRTSGFYDDTSLRSAYAAGIRRVLLKSKPRRDQPYGMMQLIQMNWFLEHGLLEFERKSKRLRIHYDRYHDVVGGLLEKVLAFQASGDKAASDAFIDRYATWSKDLHEVLAKRMKSVETYRFSLVRYEALGE